MVVRPEQLARRLVERERVRRAGLERRATELRAALATSLRRAAAQGLIRRAWIIGSLATGTFGERSDVDVVVEGLAAEVWAGLWDELACDLGVAVDLLRLEELPVTFRRRVLSEGIRLDVA